MKTKFFVCVSLLVVSAGALLFFNWQGIERFLAPTAVEAQTHQAIWCNPANTSAEDGLTKATGYKTLWTAMSRMASGDTVIIANGNWVSYPNMTIYDSNIPPSGSPGNYSKIVAETDWEVRLSNIFTYTSRSYVEIRGIVFDSRQSPAGHIVYDWSYSKFIRCGFLAGKITGNSHNCGFGSPDDTRSKNHHNLMEECIAWGGGRYVFYNKYARYNIFRRCIARHDFNGAGTDAGQIANFRSYACDYSSYQNCISLDSDRTQYYNNGTLNGEASGYWVGDNYGSLGHQIHGCISIKDLNMAYYLSGHEYNSADPNAYTVIKNSLALSPMHINGGTTLNGFILSNYCNITAENMLGFDASTDINSRGYNDKRGTPFNLKNSIALKVTGAGEVSTENGYMNYYQVGGGNWGIGSVSYNPQTNGLLYPVRIEAGSALATAGSNGGRVGPEILYQIGRDADGDGISGLAYGEPGWDEVQDGKDGRPLRKLWPFPNEAKIKELMSTTVEGVPGIYGFTAYVSPFGSPNTLTSYIWEYLGNQIPDEIYGATPEPQTCVQTGGTCQVNACDTYDACASLTGTCATGYCCSGACTAIPVLTPNITLTKTADKTQASQDEEITYTIAYNNTGTGNATNVVITDPIPTGTTYVAGSASNGGTLNGSTLSWTIASVPADATGSVSFKAKVD